MGTKKIVEALRRLDTANEEHWTADGSPRLDALGAIYGSELTREQVVKAAPEFTRESPKLPGDGPDQTKSAIEDFDDDWLDGDKGKEKLTAQIAQNEERLVEMRKQRDELNKDILEGERVTTQLYDLRDAKFPPKHPSVAIQEWIYSERKKRADRVGQEMKGPAPSAIDTALRSRRRQRPA